MDRLGTFLLGTITGAVGFGIAACLAYDHKKTSDFISKSHSKTNSDDKTDCMEMIMLDSENNKLISGKGTPPKAHCIKGD